MANFNLPVPQRTQTVGTYRGPKTSQPTIIINNTKPVRSPRRYAFRHPSRVEIGGGMVPSIKCSREDLGACVLAVSFLVGIFFSAKYGIKRYFAPKEATAAEAKDFVPDPPKIQSIVDCVNNAGEPKKFLLPDMIKEGGISIFAGREGAGKTLLGHQVAFELARGYGNFVAEGVSPQNVIIIDGEMDDEDYVERFGNMDIPSNITRISETDFANLEQLSEYIKGIIGGLLSPDTIIIDNLVALSLETLTGKAVNKFFRDLKKIQRTSEHTITFVVVDHIGKAPEGHTLDNSLLAGSANIARYAHNILMLNFSARGEGYRYIKFTKQRKVALPDEVLEMVISEEEYLHLEPIGYTQEADILNNKTNRKRYGQEVDGDEEEEPKEDGRGKRWTDEDTARLIELASTLETPDKDHIASMMNRTPDMIYKMARANGIKLMSKPRGRKPKPDLDEQ